MKLHFKSSRDPILDFFKSAYAEGKPIDYYTYQSNRWVIQKKEPDQEEDSASVAFYYYNSALHLEVVNDFSALILDSLYGLMKELVREINNGDLSKLPELLDTYLEFERMVKES